MWLTNRTPASWSSAFVNHLYDYRLNWTPLSPITIINQAITNRNSFSLIQANCFKTYNRSFPSFPQSVFWDKPKYNFFVMNITLPFILKLELITIKKISLLYSLWQGDWEEIGNGNYLDPCKKCIKCNSTPMICILTKKQTNDNTEKLQELCHVSSHLWLMFISEESVNLWRCFIQQRH